MEERMKSIEDTLKILSKDLLEFKEATAKILTIVNDNFVSVTATLSTLDKKINELNYKVDHLDNSTSTGLNDVGNKIVSLTGEIAKINKVTRYDEQFDNLKGLN